MGRRAANPPVDPGRVEALYRLHQLHQSWASVVEPTARFDPASRTGPKSDYNLHYPDLEADGDAQDAFHDAADEILGLGGRA